MKPAVDWFALSPVLALLIASGVALISAVTLPEAWRRPFSWGVTVAGFGAAITAAALLYDRSPHGGRVISDSLYRDKYSALAAIIICGAGLLTAFISYGERGLGSSTSGEHFALLASAAAGMVFLAQSANLLTLFLGLEWFSISLYVLCALERDKREAVEAGFKYLVVGSVGSAILLFGSALVYGSTGVLGYVEIAAAHQNDVLLVGGLAMLLTGIAFKASAAPFHMWTPDVYQGSPTPITAFMSAATKAAAFVLAARILIVAFPEQRELWTWALAALAVASLVVGNLAALVQTNVKRMLAYSSISHAGFLLIALTAGDWLGVRAMLYYLIPYGAMSIGAFAIVALRERELNAPVTVESLSGFGWERPMHGMAMWVFMLGFAGFPLTGGFIGKLYAFSAAYNAGWSWLVIVGLAATAVSLYYYLGIVRSMYMRSDLGLKLAPVGGSPPRELMLGTVVAAAAAVTIGSFFFAEPVLDVVRDASLHLF